jgi:hypothetical protein
VAGQERIELGFQVLAQHGCLQTSGLNRWVEQVSEGG